MPIINKPGFVWNTTNRCRMFGKKYYFVKYNSEQKALHAVSYYYGS